MPRRAPILPDEPKKAEEHESITKESSATTGLNDGNDIIIEALSLLLKNVRKTLSKVERNIAKEPNDLGLQAKKEVLESKIELILEKLG